MLGVEIHMYGDGNRLAVSIDTDLARELMEKLSEVLIQDVKEVVEWPS